MVGAGGGCTSTSAAETASAVAASVVAADEGRTLSGMSVSFTRRILTEDTDEHSPCGFRTPYVSRTSMQHAPRLVCRGLIPEHIRRVSKTEDFSSGALDYIATGFALVNETVRRPTEDNA